jgi:ubiquinone/menaquinone biosynthesis C-methylase UbiE
LTGVADAHYENPRLAALYDPLDPDRSDLEVYAAMAAEFGARDVLDIGCGTGTFGCLLAARGFTVTALDPASASLAIARSKPFADKVRWVNGTASDLPDLQVDLVTMTGNVAQVFLTDAEWDAVLGAARHVLRPGGRLVFETRDPARRAWLEWNRQDSYQKAARPGIGTIEAWNDVTNISPGLVTFRSTCVFESDGAVLTSDSTLRFRTRAEVTDSLSAAGFTVAEVRDAPDRPGREFVFIAIPGSQPGDPGRATETEH